MPTAFVEGSNNNCIYVIYLFNYMSKNICKHCDRIQTIFKTCRPFSIYNLNRNRLNFNQISMYITSDLTNISHYHASV